MSTRSDASDVKEKTKKTGIAAKNWELNDLSYFNLKTKEANQIGIGKKPLFDALPPQDKDTKLIVCLPYYHGLVLDEDLNEILKKHGQFIIRTTELNSGDASSFFLTLLWSGRIINFTMKRTDENCFLDESKRFPCVIEMLEYYIRSRESFKNGDQNVILKTPVERKSWELLHANCTLEEKLGEGAFGEVCSGTLHDYCGRNVDVAIKLVKGTRITRQQTEEIMNEARLVRALDHSNIVKCFGVAADIEPIYIVMELMRGGSLKNYLVKHGVKFDMNKRLKIMYDISSALEYLHNKGIIHCDIACRNCLYADDIVKLSDFGLSKKQEVFIMAPTDRRPIRWTAPEVFTAQRLSKANDIWALGVLFWEVMANAMEPYSTWTGLQVRDQVVTHFYQLQLSDEAPEALKVLLKRMFAYSEQDRVTIVQVLNELSPIYNEFKEKPKKGQNRKKTRKDRNNKECSKETVLRKFNRRGLSIEIEKSTYKGARNRDKTIDKEESKDRDRVRDKDKSKDKGKSRERARSKEKNRTIDKERTKSDDLPGKYRERPKKSVRKKEKEKSKVRSGKTSENEFEDKRDFIKDNMKKSTFKKRVDKTQEIALDKTYDERDQTCDENNAVNTKSLVPKSSKPKSKGTDKEKTYDETRDDAQKHKTSMRKKKSRVRKERTQAAITCENEEEEMHNRKNKDHLEKPSAVLLKSKSKRKK